MDRPLSTRAHAVIGYIVGVALIFAPNIFGFSDNGGAAVLIPRIVGIVLLLSELMTNNGLSLIGAIPMRLHLGMDILAGLFLAVSPWLWGFHNQGANAWLPHLISGLMYVGVSAMTQTEPSASANRSHHAHA
jgi:hypothetical protein